MKDKGLVVSIKGDFAQVEVTCLIDSCQSCAARIFCKGENQSKGLLTVTNSLEASAGDEVEIEIPETKYSSSLILIFGSLLISSLLGMGAGYLLSPLLPLSPQATSFLGLFFALIIAGIILYRHFRKKNEGRLYPVITNIVKKGANQE